jgi:hypothetical protein
MAERTHSGSKLRHDALQWASVIIGPVAFAIDETLGYALTYHACSTGHRYVLHLVSLLGFALSVLGIFMARAALADLPESAHEKGGSSTDRSYFMAKLGLVTSVAFTIAVVALAIPRFMLSPCE